MKIKKMKNKFGSKLFYNDKFVMVFSILVAFCSWLYVSAVNPKDTTETISEIPISLPELGNDLHYYNAEEPSATVKISGNPLVVYNVQRSDIIVTAADVSFITEPGEYNVKLVCKKGSVKEDYSFVSQIEPSSIKVQVDKNEEKTFSITKDVKANSQSDSYYLAQPKISQTAVKVSGPATIINSITEVRAEYTFPELLTTTTKVKVPLHFYDSDGKEVKSTYMKADTSEVEITQTVNRMKTLKIEPEIINMPENLSFDEAFISVAPDSARLAMSDTADLSSLKTDAIDFRQVTPENNTFTVPVTIPTGAQNIDGVTMAEVHFDTSDMTMKSFILPKDNIALLNLGSEQTASITTQSLEIKVVGPKSKISTMKLSDIKASVDMSEKSTITNGIAEMPLRIEFSKGYQDCWSQGSHSISITFSPKVKASTEAIPGVSTQ